MRNLIQDSSIPSNSLSQPLVTILLPTHNRSHLLLQALNSVFAQTYTSLQIIVADDASTDATPAILRPIIDPRLEKLSRPVNLGQMGNLNACLSCTRGEFVLVLSDDDMLLPECVAKLAESLQVYPSATMAYGQTRKETIDGQLLVNTRPSPSSIESGHEFVMKWIAGEREVAFCSAMFRTRHLREIGGFPPFPTGDAAARAAVALRGDVLHVSEMLAVYRVHSNSVTYSYSTIQWAKEELAMVDYIADHLPGAEREYFQRLGREYASRTCGRGLGDALNAGLSTHEAWSVIQYCKQAFGWSALLRWPWAGIFAKSILPTSAIQSLRELRNSLHTARHQTLST